MIIRRMVAVLVGLVLALPSLHACDACGCSASGPGIGLLTDYRNNFLRLGYFSSRFASDPSHGTLNTDQFNQIDLSGRLSLGFFGRLRLNFHLPYGFNSRSGESGELSNSGFADLRASISYALLNNVATGENSFLYLEAGAGASLPTGKFDPDIALRNLPENFNIGKGSTGYILQLNSVWLNGNSGLVFNTNIQLNQASKSGYRYGDQLHSQLTAFHEFKLGPLALIPNTGLGFEKVAYDTYDTGNRVPETGARGLFYAAALNIRSGNWFSGLALATPLSQKYSGGVVEAQNRLSCHLTFIF